MPNNPEHGDFACNAAMLLAKRLRQSPRAIAERLVAELGDADGLVGHAEVAGPGFVNVRLSDERWHELLRGELPGGLDELLADDVVFYSPIVFTPQRGKELTKLYLNAAGATFGGEPEAEATPRLSESKFRYTKEVMSGYTAFLEFETELEGKYINGVDIITCNDEGRIVEFRVMVRPLQAVNLLHQKMAAMLERMKPPAA